MVHPFKTICKHAQFEIDYKGGYSQTEFDACGGKCWKCEQPLTLDEYMSQKADTKFEDIAMSDEVRESYLKKGPECIKKLMEDINRPRPTYRCMPCFKQILDDGRKGPFKSLEEIIADMKNEKGEWRTCLEELIAEVSNCGKDCPYWIRLPTYKQRLTERLAKITSGEDFTSYG